MTMQDDSPWKPPADGGRDTRVDVSDPAAAPPPPPLPGTAPHVPPPGAAGPAIPPPPAVVGSPTLPTPAPAEPVVAAQPTMPPAASPSAPGSHTSAAPPWPGGTSPSDDAIVTTTSTPTRPGRSKWIVGGAVAGVLAVGAAGVFAVSNMTGSAQGGAETPEALGLDLLAAIESEDVLGVVDVLAPGERDVFREPMIELVSELTRLEVLSPEADLSQILGVDVELTDETVQAVSTNVADITNIDMRAQAVVTLDGSQVPIGDLITDNVPADMMTELRGTRLTQSDELDFRLTAIEDDGRWYFSAFHSIAEVARAELAPGTLIPVEGIGADGSESPEAAVDKLLGRVEGIDLTGLLRSLNPGEAAALQRYAPLFLEDAEQALAEAVSSVDFEWEITDRQLRFDGSGNTRTVLIDALAIEGSADGTEFSFSFADGCVRAEAAGEAFEQCQQEALNAQNEMLVEFPEVQELVDTVVEAFSDIEEVGLELREHDGLWYVSPTTTVSEAMLAVLRALDRSELDAIIEQAPAAGEEFGDLIFGGFEDFAMDLGGAEMTSDLIDAGDASDLIDQPVVVDVDDEQAIDEQIAELSAWDQCYSETDPDVATACFTAAAEAGSADLSAMPLVLRFPECGYTAAWGGGYYALPDAEFIAAAEAARPCFLDLVEQGQVSSYELPNEILYLECFEGRNWYNTFDDPEYDTRYFACLEEAYSAG